MYLLISPDVATTILGQIAIAIDVRYGQRYELSGIGLEIWKILHTSPAKDAFLDELSISVGELDSKAQAECLAYVDSLIKQSLVAVSDLPSSQRKIECSSSELHSLNLLAEQIRKIIEGGTRATVQISSSSMAPLLLAGDLVTIESRNIHSLREGEIIACFVGDGFLIHRFLKLENGSLYTRGDSEKYDDAPRPVEQYIGVVSELYDATRNPKSRTLKHNNRYNRLLRPLFIRAKLRLKWAVVSSVILTSNTSLKYVWRAIYRQAVRVAARTAMQFGAQSAYVIRSVAQNGFTPGGSDIDLVCVIRDNESLSRHSFLLGQKFQNLKKLYPMLTEPLVLNAECFRYFSYNFGYRSLSMHNWRLIGGEECRTVQAQDAHTTIPGVRLQISFIREMLLSFNRFLQFERLLVSPNQGASGQSSRNVFARYEVAKHVMDILLFSIHLAYGFQREIDSLTRKELLETLLNSQEYLAQQAIIKRHLPVLSGFTWNSQKLHGLRQTLEDLIETSLEASKLPIGKLPGVTLMAKASELTRSDAYRVSVPTITSDSEVLSALAREAACQHIVGLLYTLSFDPLKARTILIQMLDMIAWCNIDGRLPVEYNATADLLSNTTVAIVDKTIEPSQIDFVIKSLLEAINDKQFS